MNKILKANIAIGSRVGFLHFKKKKVIWLGSFEEKILKANIAIGSRVGFLHLKKKKKSYLVGIIRRKNIES